MNKDEMVKKLEEIEEKSKHEIPPCDLEHNDYVQIKLNRKDAESLTELLGVILSQLN